VSLTLRHNSQIHPQIQIHLPWLRSTFRSRTPSGVTLSLRGLGLWEWIGLGLALVWVSMEEVEVEVEGR